MIWKEGDGNRPWRVRLRLRGRDVQKSFPTKKAAEAWERAEHERYAREQAGLAVEQGPILYRDLADKYVAGYTVKSKGWFESMLAHSVKQFGDVYVRSLQSEDIGRWIHTDLAKLSPKTREHILGVMRQVLNAGVEWGYLSRSPARGKAVRPVKPSNEATKIFPFESWDEVERVADAMLLVPGGTIVDSAIVRFSCATGLRPEEVYGLEARDVDFKGCVAHVLRVWVKGELDDAGKTPGALRAVTLSDEAIRALRDVPWPIRGDAPIFTTPQGQRIHIDNWRKRRWTLALVKAKFTHRPLYQMRHTYATLALAEGIPLEWIASQMGHTDMRTTRKHYARFVKRVDDRMRELLNRIGGGDLSATSEKEVVGDENA